MKSRRVLGFVLALMLGITAYAAVARVQTPNHGTTEPSVAHGVSLSWAPDWLVEPLRRAIADANDPRERARGTGAPLE